MADQPGKRPTSENDPAQNKQSLPGGWHEPPVEEGSSRPVAVDAWYTPEGASAEPEPDLTEMGQTQPAVQREEFPGTAPVRTGAWYVPADALDSLLASTEEPIDEAHETLAASSEAVPLPLDATEAQPLAEGEPALAAQDSQNPPLDEEDQPFSPLSANEAWQIVQDAAPTDSQVGESSAADEALPPDQIDQNAQPQDQYADQEEPTNDAEPESSELPFAGEAPATTLAAPSLTARILPVQETPTPRLGGLQGMAPEPGIPAESTPKSDATAPQPVSPGLSPAEAALLSEQRARGQTDAGQFPAADTAAPAQTPAAQPAFAQPTSEIKSAPTTSAAPATAAPDLSQFDEVERKVKVLRQRYQSGLLTRDQFQAELRRLMFLGDDGHWWMLGVESDRWYQYDGRTWTAGNPPGYEERVRGSALRTETGLQEVISGASSLPQIPVAPTAAPTSAQVQSAAAFESGEDSLPLPKRVPQVDPAATLVSPSTPFLEPMRPSEAPTQQKSRQVDASAGEYVPYTEGEAEFPIRPSVEAAAGSADLTMRSSTVSPDLTVPRGLPSAGAAAIAEPAPKYEIGRFPQPDYSAALEIAHDRRFYVRWGVRIAVISIIAGMFVTLIALLAMIGYYFYKVDQYTEAVASLQERAANFETTLIMDANGKTLAEFNDPNTGQRKSIPLDQISPWLIHATVSTENETFYTDPGFSVSAIVRAVYQNVRSGSTVSGASTITQQLARALVLDTEFAYQRTFERKIVEVIVASEIKRKYSKNEILEIYLNEIFYGNFAYGIEAASRTYFGKPASDLNPVEAAFLAGLPQSPATYDPVVNRESAIARMHTVLRLMSEANGTGCIYIQHADTTQWGVPEGGASCIIARSQSDGSTLYYYQTPTMPEPQELTLDLARVEIANFKPPEFRATHPHFVNYVWQQLEDKYGSQAIYSAGYQVYTTLDENIQSAAERSITQRLGELSARGIDATNGSVMVMRPSDGAVVAMVGSADYYNDSIDGQVNIAFTAQQPGSSIKPFVYLTAFEPNAQGQYWTPATVIWDVYSDFSGYIPTNYDSMYHGPKTARESLANSLNVPAVKTLNYVTVERFTEMAQRIDLQFPLGDPVERQAGLPTALGAVEVRLFDMVSGYAMLANNGRRVDAYGILYIRDRAGNEIYRADTSPEGLQVVDPQYAYLITDILSDNDARAEEFGYGWPLELSGARVAAVKTGTSNDSRDNWTVGYTPQYVVGVWVGNSDNRPMYGASGLSGAAPIWNDVMETAHQGQQVTQFQPPAGITQAEVCKDSGALPSQSCAGRTYQEIFASSAPPPAAELGIFRTVQVDEFTGKLANQYCSDTVITANFLAVDDPTAISWINTTPEGNTWAQQRGIELPLAQPPTASCDPNEPRPTVVISNPAQDSTVQNILNLYGMINMPNFHHYEIRYGETHTPTTFSEPLIVANTQWPQPDSPLGQFDTRVLQNGPYTLRLIVYDSQGRSLTRDIRINVGNSAPTPLPPTPAPTITPIQPVFETPTLFPTLEGQPIVPTGPTLEPTWTPITPG
ncbi:MAG: transglycosylase domain-containing protein [Chloroflexi bacterium]|nr:transglycosylase domain-containing protein [Chloroflexota bacterium]